MREFSFIQAILVLFAVVSLAACTSSGDIPNTYYYVLDTGVQTSSTNRSVSKQGERIVKVLPVQVPDYMRQPNLVLKLQDHQIKIANYHFWAEDLRLSIQRVLLKELNAMNSDIHFSERCSPCEEILIIIDHFYPTESGEVILAGTVEIRNQQSALTRKDFHLEAELKNGGYNEAVAKMRSLLSDLSQQIKL